MFTKSRTTDERAEMFDIQVNGIDFSVDADGVIYQSHRAGSVVLDNVRRAAADHFLSAGSKITRGQRAHWFNVTRRSERTS
jgi:hypothetical protein